MTSNVLSLMAVSLFTPTQGLLLISLLLFLSSLTLAFAGVAVDCVLVETIQQLGETPGEILMSNTCRAVHQCLQKLYLRGCHLQGSHSQEDHC